MVSSIETLVKSLNRFIFTEDKTLSCINNIQVWYFVHIMTTISVQMFFYTIIFIPILFFVIFVIRLIWYRSTHVNNNFNWIIEYEHQDKYSNIIRLLKEEIILIFAYLIAAFFYVQLGLVNSNYIITYVVFIQWLIEATSTSFFIFFSIIFGYYIEWIEDSIREQPYSYLFKLLISVSLFITMRYAESTPDCWLHDHKTFLFYFSCWMSKTEMSYNMNGFDIRPDNFPGRTSTVVNDCIRRNTAIYGRKYIIPIISSIIILFGIFFQI